MLWLLGPDLSVVMVCRRGASPMQTAEACDITFAMLADPAGAVWSSTFILIVILHYAYFQIWKNMKSVKMIMALQTKRCHLRLYPADYLHVKFLGQTMSIPCLTISGLFNIKDAHVLKIQGIPEIIITNCM